MRKICKIFVVTFAVLSFLFLPGIVNASSQVYKITYQLNGAWDNYDNPEYYTKSTETFKLATPNYLGHTFQGWYKDKKFTKPVTKIKKGSKGDITLYAKWSTNKYNVKFNANGGTGTMSKLKNVKYDKWDKLPKNKFKKSGMVFVEWNTKADGTGDGFKNKGYFGSLTENNKETVTLYAIWGYKLNLDLRYTPSKDEQEMYDWYLRDAYNPNIDTTLPTLWRSGYVFKGWYTKKKGGTKVTVIKKGTTKKEYKLYAQWEKFDKNSKSQALDLAKSMIQEGNYSKKSLETNLKDYM